MYDNSSIKDSVFTDCGNGEETYLPRSKSMINYFYKYPVNNNVRFYTRTQILDRLTVFAWSKDCVADKTSRKWLRENTLEELIKNTTIRGVYSHRLQII